VLGNWPRFELSQLKGEPKVIIHEQRARQLPPRTSNISVGSRH